MSILKISWTIGITINWHNEITILDFYFGTILCQLSFELVLALHTFNIILSHISMSKYGWNDNFGNWRELYIQGRWIIKHTICENMIKYIIHGSPICTHLMAIHTWSKFSLFESFTKLSPSSFNKCYRQKCLVVAKAVFNVFASGVQQISSSTKDLIFSITSLHLPFITRWSCLDWYELLIL